MARKKATDTVEVEAVEKLDDLDEVEELDEPAETDEVPEVLEAVDDDEAGDDDDDDDLDDGSEEEDPAALDELEAAELSMLTPDEAAEVIRVDEAAEVASLRKAELALDTEADSVAAGEFVCSSCFLVKKNTQLANKRKQICNDCAA